MYYQGLHSPVSNERTKLLYEFHADPTGIPPGHAWHMRHETGDIAESGKVFNLGENGRYTPLLEDVAIRERF